MFCLQAIELNSFTCKILIFSPFIYIFFYLNKDMVKFTSDTKLHTSPPNTNSSSISNSPTSLNSSPSSSSPQSQLQAQPQQQEQEDEQQTQPQAQQQPQIGKYLLLNKQNLSSSVFESA